MKGKRISIYLPGEYYLIVANTAANNDTTISAVIQECIEKQLTMGIPKTIEYRGNVYEIKTKDS